MEGTINNKKKKIMENTYGKVLTGLMLAANPFKKMAFKTPCLVHRFINIQAVVILENEGYLEAANFYKKYIKVLNEGATWADQDFKSINHFYHNEMHKGLYGFSDGLAEAQKNVGKSLYFLEKDNLEKSVFYLGVVCHLSQDMTVPQHVNNRLLDSHKSYETWIKKKIFAEIDYSVNEGIMRYETFDDYIRENAVIANFYYEEYKSITDKDEMYEKLSRKMIKVSQNTTAGLLLDYYEQYYKKA
ncbi:MAG: zinc dependent phospholipase C family protein [Clostridiaceae bacterium]